MKLSIIIPYYNSVDNLEKLLMSVLSECEDTQIIVVDDNSTEGVDVFNEIKARYADRVEFYTNDSGVKGAGAARNIGLSRAKGNWLLFADADDYFVQGWYDAVSDYFEKDYDVIFFNTTSIITVSRELGERHIQFSDYVSRFVSNSGDRDSELYLRYFFVVPWGKLVRASMVKEHNISFDEVLYSNDVMFSEKTGFYAKSIFADLRTIYCVTQNVGGLSRNFSEEAWGIRYEVFCRRNLFLRNNLNKEDYRFNMKRLGPHVRLKDAIKRKCGFSTFVRYLKMFRKHRVPLAYSIAFGIRCKIAVLIKKAGSRA